MTTPIIPVRGAIKLGQFIKLASLAEEVIVHLRRGGADGLEIAVSIDATRYAGFDRATVRTVSENARVLRLKPGRFEG